MGTGSTNHNRYFYPGMTMVDMVSVPFDLIIKTVHSLSIVTIMKTRIILGLITLLLLTMGFAGCGEEGDDYSKTVSEMLVGKWKLVKIGSNTAVSEEYLTIKAKGSFALDFYDPRKESRVVAEDIYEQLEDWAYDEQKKQFSTLIQLGTSSIYPYYCTLNEKEMILTPKYPDEWREYYFLQYYYIKVK